mgnify:CR=1 FL=1
MDLRLVAGGRYGTKSKNLSGDKLNLVAGGRFGIKSCLIDLDPNNDNDFLIAIEASQI